MMMRLPMLTTPHLVWASHGLAGVHSSSCARSMLVSTLAPLGVASEELHDKQWRLEGPPIRIGAQRALDALLEPSPLIRAISERARVTGCHRNWHVVGLRMEYRRCLLWRTQ